MFSVTKDKSCCSKDDIAVLANKAGHKLREVVDSASDETRDAKATIIKEVRQHPVQAGAIAAGIGFVLGFLLRRR